MKKLGFLCVFGYLFFKFQKNTSQKLSMLEQKTKTWTDLESALNSAQNYEAIFFNFRLIILMIKDLPTEKYFFPKILIFLTLYLLNSFFRRSSRHSLS